MAQFDRQGYSVLEDTQVINEIIEGTIKNSAFLSLARRLPNMSSSKTEMKVLDSLPMVYFVNPDVDNGRKKITEMEWDKKTIYAEEMAVIVPIKEDIIDDSSINIFGEYKKRIGEAAGKVVDLATITGIGKPSKWRAGILPSIINAGAVVSPDSGQSLYSQINDAMVYVEESGYNPNAIMGGTDIKGKFRMMLDDIGQPVTGTEIGNLPRHIVDNGAWDKSLSQMIVGDFSQAVYAIRQDITYKILTEGVIQDPATGDIMYNLAQEDMVALRVVMRLGWEIPNPINALNQDESVRFPFASIAPATPTVNTKTVTFTVTDSASTPNNIDGAKVVCGGVTKYTNSTGKAEFKVPDGKYNYKVTKKGYNSQSGSVDVDGAENVTVKLS